MVGIAILLGGEAGSIDEGLATEIPLLVVKFPPSAENEKLRL
jgi:hypothetical protein